MSYTPVEYYTGPAHNAKVTSPFGPRKHPISGQQSHHNGTDFGGRSRGHIWTSPYPGVVTHVGTHGSRGLLVVVRIAPQILQIMQHLDKALVKVGDTVTAGTPIGTNGITGSVTGPHLHYELRWDNGSSLGNPVWGDPALFTLEEVTGMKAKLYTVVKGDTLAKIATKFGVTVAQLRQWNNRTPDQDRSLAIGTVLFVSEPVASKPPGVGQEAFDQLTARVKALEDKLAGIKKVL